MSYIDELRASHPFTFHGDAMDRRALETACSEVDALRSRLAEVERERDDARQIVKNLDQEAKMNRKLQGQELAEARIALEGLLSLIERTTGIKREDAHNDSIDAAVNALDKVRNP
jgi:hypothetical protein